MTITTYSAPDLNVYFQSKRAGLDAELTGRLVEFIAATETSLDCAIYDLRHPQILAALTQLASRPHVRLRIAFDGSGERAGGGSGDPKPSGTAQALDQAGLRGHATAIHEHGRHLMHDKYLVRDGQAVWVGSANFTVGGLELQDNNCLEITSPALAAIYTDTFAELISPDHERLEHAAHAGERHAAQHVTTPAAVAVDGAHITPYFAPAAGEGIEQALVAAIRQARRIRVLAFLISDPGVLDALAPFAANHRFDIRGVYDPHGMQDVTRAQGGHQAHAGRTGKAEHAVQSDARFWFLHDPRFIAAPSHGFSVGREQDFMHNKVIVIDDRLVFTGSYNFSENAEENDETLLAIDSPALASAYTAYFDALADAYAHAAGREPVAVGVVASAAHAALHSTAAASVAAPVQGDDLVAQLRREHERAGQVAKPARSRRAAGGSAGSVKRSRSGLDVAITLVLILVVLTALALIAYGELILHGVSLLR
jgi:phosphatidylserine/phosphatidylglycerophosphate/cardiolipin synthase-like enzyme